jgi:Protein of unknown function (DUF1064)
VTFPRRPKYKNKPTEIDGRKFSSQKEAKRYKELRFLELVGEISALECQVVFELAARVHLYGRWRPVLRYIADFVYQKDGVQIVEDTKGFRTEGYRIKRHLMRSRYGIELLET